MEKHPQRRHEEKRDHLLLTIAELWRGGRTMTVGPQRTTLCTTVVQRSCSFCCVLAPARGPAQLRLPLPLSSTWQPAVVHGAVLTSFSAVAQIHTRGTGMAPRLHSSQHHSGLTGTRPSRALSPLPAICALNRLVSAEARKVVVIRVASRRGLYRGPRCASRWSNFHWLLRQLNQKIYVYFIEAFLTQLASLLKT